MVRSPFALTLFLASVALTFASRDAAAQATCAAWQPGFAEAGPDAPFRDFVTFDDGSGPALYAGGDFRAIGGVPMSGVVRWSGSSWTQLGSDFADVGALTVFDDGTGPRLVAAGELTPPGGPPRDVLARWDGASWTALPGEGPIGVANDLRALATFDDGTGPALYLGGSVLFGAPSVLRSVVRWRNGVWSDASTGLSTWTTASAFAAFDPGTGARLHVSVAEGGNGPSVLSWNGASWNATNPELRGADVSDLATFSAGGTTVLAVSGDFLFAGAPLSASGVAQFDGASWTVLGNQPPFPRVEALTVHDVGSATQLVAAGPFTSAGGSAAPGFAAFDGASWSALTDPLVPTPEVAVTALDSFDDGSGSRLVVSGPFRRATPTPIARAAVLGPTGWAAMQAGLGISGSIGLLRSTPGHVAPGLIAFWNEGREIAALHQGAWSSLGRIEGTVVRDLIEVDLGAGPRVIASGQFARIGGIAARNVASWDGDAWSPLGAGIPSSGSVGDLVVFDSGAGPRLHAARLSAFGGGQLAQWDGATWTIVGPSANLEALAVYDDGTGPALYAAAPAAPFPQWSNVLRWNGATWIGVGFVDLPPNGRRPRLAVASLGAGPVLYLSGDLLLGSPPVAAQVARWNGTAWIAVLAGSSAPSELAVVHTNAGPRLAAVFDATTTSTVRLYDGAQWGAPLGSIDGSAATIATHDADGDGTPELFVGGAIVAADGVPSSGIAQYALCDSPSEIVCAGDGTGAACPCGNTGASGNGCANSLHAAGASLASDGLASLSHDTLRLEARGLTGTFAVFAQGTSAAGAGGVPFGDGLRCLDGAVLRLASAPITNGAAAIPSVGGASISLRGSIGSAGSTRVYQAIYRNSASFCTSSSSNATNGLRLTWSL